MPRFVVLIIAASLLLGFMIGYSNAFLQFRSRGGTGAGSMPPSGSREGGGGSATRTFPQVIRSTTGQPVLPLDENDQPVVDAIGNAADATLQILNSPNSPLVGLARINEASRHFEDSLRVILDGHPHLRCSIPETAAGGAQRAGYPDLEITHLPTGKTYYLDPKVYEEASESSSLRTFYYSPQGKTSKILKPARHLLLGFAHDGKDGQWTFERWTLVDLSRIRLKLKSEFNAANVELYSPKTIIRTSKP